MLRMTHLRPSGKNHVKLWGPELIISTYPYLFFSLADAKFNFLQIGV